MQVDVERADVEHIKIEVLGWREVDVGQQGRGRGILEFLVEIPEKAGYADFAVPPDNSRGDFVSNGEEKGRGVC
jgi:hypothetical protein